MAQKKPKPAFQPESALIPLLIGEQDRGCVLVGHAYLDFKLGQRLEQFFISRVTGPDGTVGASDEFTIGRLLFGRPDETEAIAGSYAVRVSLARICGLIDADTCIALRKLNGLRILCAHNPSQFQLRDDSVEEIRKRMSPYWHKQCESTRLSGLIERIAGENDVEKWSDARIAFMYTVLTLLQPVQGVQPLSS